ncbi:MAG: serine protease [Planctomycetaceae bacterium]
MPATIIINSNTITTTGEFRSIDMRPYLFLLPTIGMLLLGTSPMAAQVVESSTFPSTSQRLALQSIVKIHDRTDNVQGSGFVIGRDAQGRCYIMTCAHVADLGHRFELDFYPHNSIDVREGIEIVAHDERRDLAVLRVPNGHMAPCLLLSRGRPLPQGRFETLVVGFPHGERTTRVLTSAARRTEDGRDNLYLSDQVGPGASGSPVMVRRGHLEIVVGVYWGHNDTQGIATVDLDAFQRENNLSTLQDDLNGTDVAALLIGALEVLVQEFESKR